MISVKMVSTYRWMHKSKSKFCRGWDNNPPKSHPGTPYFVLVDDYNCVVLDGVRFKSRFKAQEWAAELNAM